MKKIYIILALALFTSVAVEAQTVNITFRVTLKGTGKPLSADGLRVVGAFTSAEQAMIWDPANAKKMTLVGTPADSIYAVTLTAITRPTSGVLEFKFLNGAIWGDGSAGGPEDERGLTTVCAKADRDNRIYTLPNFPAIMMPAFRFNSCTQVLAGVNELSTVRNMDIYPNPAKFNTTLTFDNLNSSAHALEILNVTGQLVRTYAAQTGSQFSIERGTMPAGMYFARVKNTVGESKTVRFVFE